MRVFNCLIHRLMLSALLYLVVVPSYAQEESTDFISASSIDIPQRIQWVSEEKQTHFEGDWLSFLNRGFVRLKDRWTDPENFAMILEYRALYQRATAGKNPKDASGGDLALRGIWFPFDIKTRHFGFLGFTLEQRHRYGEIPPESLADQIGVLGSPAGSFDDEPLNLNQLWWEQHLWNSGVVFRVGKLDLESIIDTYDYKDEDLFFFNEAFSTNLSIPMPDKGLGCILQLSPSDTCFINVAVADVNAINSRFDWGSAFSDANFIYLIEFGMETCTECFGEGKYHITYWYASSSERNETPCGRGATISLQQAFNEKLTVFARYGYSHNNAATLRHMLQVGFGVHGMFSYRDDIFGLGATFEQPSDQSLREQTVFEMFYVFQLTRSTEITPNLQLILHPTDNLGQDVIAVFGLRMFITFG